jgi:hypothetical protein
MKKIKRKKRKWVNQASKPNQRTKRTNKGFVPP